MGLNKVIVASFKRGFEEKCFQLITESYVSAMETKVIKLNWDENDITSELHEHIKENPIRLKWSIVTNVEQHLPKDDIEREKGFAAKLPRIDLRLVTINSSLEYEYHMEAKNLKEKDSGLKRRYIDTGINSFVSKKYENGCLLGYVLEGDLDNTVDGVNKLLKKDDRQPEFLKPKLYHLHDKYYESEHPDDMVIRHFMFDFTTLNSA
ncbi:hypothetical protein [Maribacter sp. 4G9]|uniref:Restriction endonuclease n=1 Tax=Croceitalea marina TaxID=1775166 RepID=A0ABW5N063_9FLAO|nr:hypothetical protein [Maribacter sp. 4G9]PIB38678.1 hypothetical protein BFP75_15505 [Maribacter sp. 4G9]|tara:strand:- start:364 stop:984 length:621 start_codon:yes stop_codon:yes gene_type:complete